MPYYANLSKWLTNIDLTGLKLRLVNGDGHVSTTYTSRLMTYMLNILENVFFYNILNSFINIQTFENYYLFYFLFV